ncbi:unnamed protein product [Protopolystoma xenopodis]|uniref:Uncharacterized protein n=1 Tax=Protopolystoma xenopodis TaxID=117903 RepID=A0A3S5A6F0_9PLAT|nr:unnamed protein product [Protopolystoma xenopodis]
MAKLDRRVRIVMKGWLSFQVVKSNSPFLATNRKPIDRIRLFRCHVYELRHHFLLRRGRNQTVPEEVEETKAWANERAEQDMPTSRRPLKARESDEERES